jgi:hypothetical protein
MRLRLLAAVCALAAGVAAVVIIALLAAPIARADGDPASDWLLSQPAFTSYDKSVSKSEAAKLVAMLTDAKKKGFPLKVAVIVSPYDLGAVPVLYKRPQTYAKFLGQEIYFVTKDELLVVMPNGYGIYKAQGLPAADKALVAGLPKLDTSNGTALVQAAQQAVQKLAARRGIALSASSASSGGSSVWVERGEIAGAVVVIGLLTLGGRWIWRRRHA